MTRERFFSRYYSPTADGCAPFAPLSLGYNNYRVRDAFPLGRHPPSHVQYTPRGRLLDSLTLVHVLRGHGTFRSELCDETPIRAGMVFVVHPNVRHLYRAAPKVGWDDEWLELRGSDAAHLPDLSAVDPRAPFRELPRKSVLPNLFRKLFDIALREPSGGLRLASAAYCVIAEILSLWREKPHADPVSEAVEQLRALIESNLGGKRTIEDLSHDCGLSASRLRAAFTETFRLSPKRYQLDRRIARAKELLEATELTVTDIAEQTGFESVYAFSRQFKRETHLSPRAFRLR